MATTLSIELPDDLVSRLQEAGIAPEDAGRYALVALSEVADNAELTGWWASLTPEQQEEERSRTLASVTAADAGDLRSLSEVITRIKADRS